MCTQPELCCLCIEPRPVLGSFNEAENGPTSSPFCALQQHKNGSRDYISPLNSRCQNPRLQRMEG
eukprot:scaffold13330_cov205-Alexandrium_tamarense.AAC.18